MHLFESWLCNPKLNIEVLHKTDFESSAKKSSAYSIYLVCETEVKVDHEPFSYATGIYGDIRHSILYPAQPVGKQMFIIIPTQSEPKKLSLEPCGKPHQANHYGTVLAQALLALPLAHNVDSEFCITLSERMKQLIEGEQHEFLLGVLQRSVSYKIKKTIHHEKKSHTLHTLLFRSELFPEFVLNKARIISKSMSITRTLINMPANILNPQTYEECVQFLVDDASSAGSIQMEVLNNDQLKNLGCGLICAVGQGSAVPPRVVKLTYNPNEIKHVALVGKGITFDSGGYNLKPASGMRTMKKDMGGSAAVLGTFFACAQLKLPLKLTCYLAIAENMISGGAMRPGDIYTAHNGMNVEIDNTDAEGRLVLADALSLALEDKPDWIIDLATLTGAARTALGPLVDPAFGNRTSLNQMLEKLSLETGDWIWNLPLPQQYDAYFDSRIADIMNGTTTPYAGCITAALFLKKFVGTCPWNHIDTFMWCDKVQGMWGEDNAPTAKCVRLIVRALEHYSLNIIA